MSTHFLLYGRENCHLCHDMHEELRVWQTRLQFSFEMIDIENDAALELKFGLMIPVLTTPNQDIVCFGCLDSAQLQHSLSQKS